MATEKKEKYPSTITLENFSSTATLTNNDQIKVPIDNSKIDNDEYDPFEHRDLQHANTFSGALIHLLKSSLGTGILAIPRAFKNAGLVVGLIGTFVIGFLCTYTVHVLVKASLDMCKKSRVPSLGYAETAEEVFKNGPKKLRPWATFAKNFVEIALVLTYYIANAVYIVFISESIIKLLRSYYPEEAEQMESYMAWLILIPLVICCQVRELKYLVPFSFVANTTMIVAFAITLYYVFKDIGEVDISDRKLSNDITLIPSFFSTVIFAMEGIGAVMPVENSMLKPQFIGCPGVLNIAMTAVVSLYAAIGFFGYLRFGEATEATITTNLPSDEIPAQVTQVCISVAVFFTFMLQFYVPMDITWRRLKNKISEKRHNLVQIALRIILPTIIVGIAAAAGNRLGGLIDLVGSIFFSTLGLTLPAFINIVVTWDDWGRFNWKLFKDILIMIISIFGLVSGSYYAVLSLINE